MAFTQTNAIAIVLCDALVDAIDTGGGTATIKVYDNTDTVPAFADDGLGTNVLLATVDLANPAFGAAVDGTPGAVATLLGVPLSDNSIDATGTAAFFRVLDRAGTTVFQGGVGTAATEMIVNSTSFQSGATFTINSCTVTIPEA